MKGTARKGIAIVRVLEYHKTINQRGRGHGFTPGQQRRRTLPFRRTDCKSADGAVDERKYVLPPLRKSHLSQFENNRPVADFYCPGCGNEYELKSKNGILGNKITDGAYDTMIARITIRTYGGKK